MGAQILSQAKIPFFIADSKGRYTQRRALTEDQIIKASGALIKQRVKSGVSFDNAQMTKQYLREKIHHLEHEVFVCLFLDNKHRLIHYEEMFRGTVDGANVYPREVVKRALHLNSTAIIFAHNHPSGIATPSRADLAITQRLITALNTVDIRVLEHIIVGFGEPYSFAENNKL